MSTETNSKILYYQDEYVKFEFEVLYGIVNLHVEVFKFSPRGLRNMYLVFETFKQEALDSGHYMLYAFSPNPKFCELFGGEVIRDMYNYKVVRWVLKQR